MSSEKEEKGKKAEAIRFTAHQRISLLPMLPAEGSYFNIQKRREVREALAFNDQEIAIANKYLMNWKKIDGEVGLKRMDLGEWITNNIKGQLKKLYDDEKLTEDTIDLYDILIGNKDKN